MQSDDQDQDKPKKIEHTIIFDDETMDAKIKKTAPNRRWLHRGYDQNDDNFGT